MKTSTIVLTMAAAVFSPCAASAQTVDQLMADHVLLNAELERCKQLGMASVNDARCKTAREAENKRFFGTGSTYTPAPVNIFPNTPTQLVPAEKQKPIQRAPTLGPPNG
jgi:conjugative transfer region protein TrbK